MGKLISEAAELDIKLYATINKEILDALNGDRFRPENSRKSLKFKTSEELSTAPYHGAVVTPEENDIISQNQAIFIYENETILDVTSITNLVEDIQHLTRIRGERFALEGVPSINLFCQRAEEMVAERIMKLPSIVENNIRGSVVVSVNYASTERYTDEIKVRVTFSAYDFK